MAIPGIWTGVWDLERREDSFWRHLSEGVGLVMMLSLDSHLTL